MDNAVDRHVFYISDGTAITAEVLGHAVMSQFPVTISSITLPFVENESRARAVKDQIDAIYHQTGVRPLVFYSIVLPEILPYLEKQGAYKVLLLPDHPTPIATMTHASDPVPYLLFSSQKPTQGVDTINEETAKSTGVFLEDGTTLMRHFIDF